MINAGKTEWTRIIAPTRVKDNPINIRDRPIIKLKKKKFKRTRDKKQRTLLELPITWTGGEEKAEETKKEEYIKKKVVNITTTTKKEKKPKRKRAPTNK